MGFSIKKFVKKPGNILAAAANPLMFLGTGGATGKVGQMAIDALKGPKIPAPPGISQQEWDAYLAQQAYLNDNTSISNQLSGLYGADGQLDPDAVARMRAQVGKTQEQGQELVELERQRYLNALSGKAPVSVGLQQEEEEAFKQFRAEMARRGGGVEGTSFANATGQSTAANQRAAAMSKAYGFRADEERREALNAGRTNTMGFFTGERAQPYAQGLGFFDRRAQMLPMYQSAAQPFGAQRGLEYNAQLAKAGQKSASRNALFGAVGTGLGFIAGGPVGAMVGSQVGSRMGG
jgi:hypothetical protein